jgi:malonate transporter
MVNAINLNEQSLFVIFAVIFIGIICQKRKILTQVQIEGFEVFLFKIAMPCYLFTSTLQHDLSVLLHTKYIISYLLTFLAIASLVILLFYRVSSQSSICVKILAAGYVNSAIYTLPIIVLLLKDPTAGILSNLLQVIIIQSIFIVILSFINHKEKSIAKKLMTILSTPLIIMPILGLVCNFLHFSPHRVIAHAIQNIGSGTTSIALFTFGLTLGGIKISRSSIDKNLLIIVGISYIR